MSADGPGQNRLSAAHRSLSLLFFTRHPGDNPSTQPATRGRHTPPGRRPQSTAPHEGGTHASRETTPAHSPLGGWGQEPRGRGGTAEATRPPPPRGAALGKTAPGGGVAGWAGRPPGGPLRSAVQASLHVGQGLAAARVSCPKGSALRHLPQPGARSARPARARSPSLRPGPSPGAETVLSRPLELLQRPTGRAWPPSNMLGATVPDSDELLGHGRKPGAEAMATTVLRDPGRLHAQPLGPFLPPRQGSQHHREPAALPGDRPNLSLYARVTLDPAGSLAGPPAPKHQARLLAPDAVAGGALILCAQHGPCPAGVQLQPGGQAGPTGLPQGLAQHARSSPVSFPCGRTAGPGQAPLCWGQSSLRDRTPCWNLRAATGQGPTVQN